MSEALDDYYPIEDDLTPPVEWIVQDLLMHRNVNLVVGMPKAGKTRFVIKLLADVLAKGTIGDYDGLPVGRSPERVGWIGFDPGWRAQLKDARTVLGIPAERIIVPSKKIEASLSYGTVNADEVSKAWLNAAENMKAKGVELIVVDHLLGALGARGANEDTAVAPLLRTLAQIADSGMTLVVIHHTSIKSFGNEADSPMGHTLITATARQILSVRAKAKGKDHQEVFVRGNDAPEMCLVMQPIGTGPLKSEWWGRAEDKPSAYRGEKPRREKPQKAERADLALGRTQFILDGPDSARANQSAAGRYLESAPKAIKGDLTNGRQCVVQLISKGLLGTDSAGKIVAGPKWRA